MTKNKAIEVLKQLMLLRIQDNIDKVHFMQYIIDNVPADSLEYLHGDDTEVKEALSKKPDSQRWYLRIGFWRRGNSPYFAGSAKKAYEISASLLKFPDTLKIYECTDSRCSKKQLIEDYNRLVPKNQQLIYIKQSRKKSTKQL